MRICHDHRENTETAVAELGRSGKAKSDQSVGPPLPGEVPLLATAAIAGTTHELNIALVACGAIPGDNVGYWIGHEFGYRLLLRYGRYLRFTEPAACARRVHGRRQSNATRPGVRVGRDGTAASSSSARLRLALFAATIFLRRHEAEPQTSAAKALRGPLRPAP